MPAFPARFRVLFVCIGNVCRSPLGERLLQARLPEGYDVSSAGVGALVGSPMDPAAAAELAGHGGSAEGFVARQLSEPMVQQADLVLTATRDIRSRVLSEFPSALQRTFTAREFAALLDHVDADSATELVAQAAAARSRVKDLDLDVPDPFRRTPQAHAESARLMAEAVERIAKGLTPGHAG